MTTAFPPANYFIASSRLRPGLDGGYTVATMRRALQYAEFGGVQPVLLAFDFWPEYDAIKQEFIAMGLATEATELRGLYQDLRDTPSIIRDVARANGVFTAAPAVAVTSTTDLDSTGRAWRTLAKDAAGTIVHTDFLDSTGALLFRLPYISGRPDWWRSELLIDVFDGGELVGQLRGFGELYQAWVRSLVAAVDGPSIVVVEARQVGEMLIGDAERQYSIVHTVHNAHTAAPHNWDSEMDETWTGWFEVIDQFDAVIWLTEQQRKDAERRFAPHPGAVVIPHPAEPIASFPDPYQRDPNLAIMVARLAEQKRIAHAIRAWPIVVARNPAARLEIYGEGMQRPMLEQLAAELGVTDSVHFMGYDPNASAAMERAGLLIVSSNYEGHSLVVLEAFSRGCPIVAYDISYGPAETIVDGVNGLIVPAGDIPALGEAVASLLGDADRIAAYSNGAYQWAREHGIEMSMTRSAELFESVLGRIPAGGFRA